jgi:hypothetical protein
VIDYGIQHGKVEREYNIPQLILKALKMNGGHKIEDWRGRRMTNRRRAEALIEDNLDNIQF